MIFEVKFNLYHKKHTKNKLLKINVTVYIRMLLKYLVYLVYFIKKLFLFLYLFLINILKIYPIIWFLVI